MKEIGTRVAGYVRVSTTDQASDGYGLAAQRSAIENECERRGWELMETFSDEGESGKNLDRPALKEASQSKRDAQKATIPKLDAKVRREGFRLFGTPWDGSPQRRLILGLQQPRWLGAAPFSSFPSPVVRRTYEAPHRSNRGMQRHLGLVVSEGPLPENRTKAERGHTENENQEGLLMFQIPVSRSATQRLTPARCAGRNLVEAS